MYVTVNQTHYWVEVAGTGQPLVLLHGFTGSHRTWEGLSWPGIKTIMVDLPGHGCTKVERESPLTMEECCQELMQLFQHLHLDSFYLLGYSLGGRTALSYALLYPEKVKGIVLESASPGLNTLQEREERQQKDERIAAMLESEGIGKFVDFWENLPLFDTQKAMPRAKQAKIRQERLWQDAEGLAFSLRGMGTGRQPSWWESLNELSHPFLLIAGEQDQKFLGIGQAMEERFRHAYLEVVPSAGHAVHVEKPDIFAKIVSDFVIQ
ncbi:2-succinyl-6-hydroxy-2,4-cyclohexadiene-1-carboxylate synthase [Thalassobacillus sp. CUG 92003]|uniref:2-succinyl-6-hydroxy-2, 4-cyclohexadiene-1-carboxylate synthase n=1 Tax=Thalassobacillus sp. CUG 92003 TaxID=2736641 RepID=UPI0015E7AB2A|nr:2-succinyl-6-hydroxy-2,4-cyclohexadiene-1-carboxylate synthase [Thalassobacillus sp. CUG 92003]